VSRSCAAKWVSKKTWNVLLWVFGSEFLAR
jgi:hypothetical protein